MKTKFILTAMCLPLAFAACTNEDLVIENQNSVEDRPVVDFKLAATYGADGAETRMVNNNGTFLWEGTDVLGASLVLNPASENNIYSNYKFVNELEEASSQVEFTTEATTVVGEYMFYYPYNTAMTKDLTGIRYALKEPQVYDPTGEEMMKNNFMIAPRVKVDGNEPGELSLPITMRSIYAYGQLDLNLADYLMVNNTIVSATSVNVQKIILTYQDIDATDGVNTSKTHKDGVIFIKQIPDVDLTAATLEELREGNNTTYKGKTDAELRQILLAEADKELTAQGTYPLLQLTAEDDNTADGCISQVSISCVGEGYPNGVTLNKGGQFSTRVLLPTQKGAVVNIDVYTNLGKFSTTTGSINVLPNHKTILREQGTVKDVVTMGQFNSSRSVNAISEADFIASMSQFNGLGEKNVPVTVGNFDLTATAIAAVPANVTLDFDSNVTFNGNMTLAKMKFEAGKTVTLKGGNITLGSDLIAQTATTSGTPAVTIRPTIKVAGANVTLTKDNLNDADVAITSGSLTISATNSLSQPCGANFTSATISGGTLNVNKGLNSVIMNGGTLNNAAGSNIATLKLRHKNATVENNGTIANLANGGETWSITSDGTTTNGTYYGGIVNNYSLISGGTNAKTINQMGSSSKLTLATNTGTINTVAYSQTTVADNNGEINFVINARVSANGTVTYQAPADIAATSFAELPTAITKIVFGSDFNYNHPTGTDVTAASTGAKLPTNVTYLEFQGNLKLSQDWVLNEGSTIFFNCAAANITGAKTISNVETIAVGNDKGTEATSDDIVTDLYIATNTKITGVKKVVFEAGASIWNDGSVTKVTGVTVAQSGLGTWGGNAIN